MLRLFAHFQQGGLGPLRTKLAEQLCEVGRFAPIGRGKGFVIRSAPNPSYVKWQDECRIPFELRVRGRIQLDYYHYKATDAINHQTGQPATQNANSVRFPDFSALEIKRGNLIFEGTVFDPDLPGQVGTFTIVGGTGRFRGAAGGGSFEAVITGFDPVETLELAFDGTIDF